MADIVVAVPKRLWDFWLREGDLAGEPWSGKTYAYSGGGPVPKVELGDRVYICAYGRLRGYAPLQRLQTEDWRWQLLRGGDAVAVTIGAEIPGFRGWRYRWWSYDAEYPFPNWQEVGMPRETVARR